MRSWYQSLCYTSRMRLRIELVVLALAIAFAGAIALPPPAGADRSFAFGPFELAALADLAVVGTLGDYTPFPVKSARLAWDPDGEVVVHVERTLKGTAPGPTLRLGLAERGRDSFVPTKGARFALFLSAPRTPADPHWRLLDERDAALPATPASLEKVLPHLAHPCCAWREGAAGVRAALLPDADGKLTFRPGDEISLRVFLQNHGTAPVTLTAVHWPRAAMTHAELTVTRARAPVAAHRIDWLGDAEIAKYFSRLEPWRGALDPGGATVHHLQRISSAERGWGYKEDIGFVWYPLDPGDYEVSAVLKHAVAEADEITAGPIRLTVTRP